LFSAAQQQHSSSKNCSCPGGESSRQILFLYAITVFEFGARTDNQTNGQTSETRLECSMHDSRILIILSIEVYVSPPSFRLPSCPILSISRSTPDHIMTCACRNVEMLLCLSGIATDQLINRVISYTNDTGSREFSTRYNLYTILGLPEFSLLQCTPTLYACA